jgi:NAD(P)H-hydrate epimerase
MELIDAALLRSALPVRARDSHKGTFGHIFVVAGSRGKSGAALMTGLAALRSGAGLVTLWLPASLQRNVVGKVPELMTEFLPETPAGSSDVTGAEEILHRLSDADALVVGPGLTREAGTRKLIRKLVARSSVPVVLDADGINAYASHPESLLNREKQPVIITPHPGEMARLAGTTIAEVQKNRLENTGEFARLHNCYTILKGFQTVIASPGGRILINGTGNPGMATGGTGDILAGMVGRFVAAWNLRVRRVDDEALAVHLAAAVFLHGLAGDLAAADKGEESLIATDLLAHLPAAFKQVRKSP